MLGLVWGLGLRLLSFPPLHSWHTHTHTHTQPWPPPPQRLVQRSLLPDRFSPMIMMAALWAWAGQTNPPSRAPNWTRSASLFSIILYLCFSLLQCFIPTHSISVPSLNYSLVPTFRHGGSLGMRLPQLLDLPVSFNHRLLILQSWVVLISPYQVRLVFVFWDWCLFPRLVQFFKTGTCLVLVSLYLHSNFPRSILLRTKSTRPEYLVPYLSRLVPAVLYHKGW